MGEVRKRLKGLDWRSWMGDECEWKREPLFQTLMKTYKTVFIFILRRCMNRIVIGTIIV